MNVYSRGVRNAFRNAIRTFSIVLILGLSVGLALAMLVARQAVSEKINTVKSSVGNTITVSPAGARGFEGGGTPLTTQQLSKVSALPHVTKVSETLNDRLTTSDTNLVSAIDPGTLGQRFSSNSGVSFQGPPPSGRAESGTNAGGDTGITRTFTPPVTVTGTNDLSQASAYGGSTVTYTSGQALDPTKDDNVAVIGKALATKNNLSLNSTFTAYGATIKVVGIYDAGNTFANAGLIMSLPTVERLSAQPNDVTAATVTIDSIDNLTSVTTAVTNSLGSAADVTNNQQSAQEAVQPLENVKSISLFSLIGALGAGAIIILLTMMMIVRERRREIGVMKAIGSSNLKTMLQFVSEAVTLTTLGMIVGLAIGVTAANPITKVLVNNSTSSSQTTQTGGGPGGQTASGAPVFRASRGLRGFGSTSISSVKDVKASVKPSIFAYGIGAALLIAVIGSALPALFISKIRPAEVMRAD